MNIIFGKYQLSLPIINNFNQITNKSSLCLHRFTKVRGFGITKIKWILAAVGGTQNLRIAKFYKNSRFINREKQVENIVKFNYFQFLGTELTHLVSHHKARINKFVPSSRLRRKKYLSKRNIKKKLSNFLSLTLNYFRGISFLQYVFVHK
jgi:hypothetical protein